MTSQHGYQTALNYRFMNTTGSTKPIKPDSRISSRYIGSMGYPSRVSTVGSTESRVKPHGNTIYSIVYRNPAFSIFKRMIDDSGLRSLYDNKQGSITLFLPPNSAFEKMPPHMLNEMDRQTVRKLVLFHTVKSEFLLEDMLHTKQYVETYHPKENLFINGMGLTPKIGHRHLSASAYPSINAETSINKADIQADNGVIHVVSSPLIPGA